MPVLPRDPIQLQGGSVDLMRRLVHVDDRDTTLTAREVELLHYLWRHAGRVVTREELLEEVWGYSADMVTRTVDNTVRRLRKKVERDAKHPRHVLTEFGEGYRFAPLREAGPELPSGHVAIVGLRIGRLDGLRARSETVAVELMATFDAVLRAAAEELGGVVYADAGATRVAFAIPKSAVAFAVRLQEALCAAPWSGAVLEDVATGPDEATIWRGPRVACSVVVGQSTPGADGAGAGIYEGPIPERATLLADAANGGQILLGPAAWLAVAPADDLDLHAVPVGAHHLKGQPAPLSLVSVVPMSLRARRFPPVRSLEVRQTNVAAEATSFVGRRRDLVALRGYFARGVRLLTILGPAGAGKTRLSRHYGLQRTDALSANGGGVWFCDLASSTDADQVVSAVAGALHVPLDPTRAGADDALQVGRALAARGRLLLILDNAEQVVDGLSACVALWREAAPDVRMLVTSREPLGNDDELVHPLGPLDAPEALALFVDRARGVRLDFQLAEEDVGAVAEIADRLDFNPLALELAAVRVKVLPPRSLASRLGQRFTALGSGPRDSSERHRTLHNAIDWSWTMLSEQEQRVLACVSCFRGGFSLGAAAAVVGDGATVDTVQLTLAALRDKSLVRAFEPASFPSAVRFSLLESIAAFAHEHLVEQADPRALHTRLATWAVSEGERWLGELDSVDGGAAVEHLTMEVDNLRVAFEAAVVHDPTAAVRLAVVLDAVLAPRGPYDGHLHLLDRAVEVGEHVDPVYLVPLLLRRAGALTMRHDAAGTERDLLSAARLAADDTAVTAMALLAIAGWQRGRAQFAEAVRLLDSAESLGGVPGDVLAERCRLLAQAGRFVPALEASEQALQVLRDAGRSRAEGELLVDAASWAAVLGRVDEAHALYRPALQVARRLGDLRLEGRVLLNLGELLGHLGHREQAADHLRLALELHRRVGDRRREGVCLGHLGVLLHLEGEHQDAIDALDGALTALDQADHTRGEAWFLVWRGTVMHELGRLHDAVDATQRALARLREIEDQRLQGRAATRTVPLLLELGRKPEAVRAATEAARLLNACEDGVGLHALAVVLAALDGKEEPDGMDVLEVQIVRRLMQRVQRTREEERN